MQVQQLRNNILTSDDPLTSIKQILGYKYGTKKTVAILSETQGWRHESILTSRIFFKNIFNEYDIEYYLNEEDNTYSIGNSGHAYSDTSHKFFEYLRTNKVDLIIFLNTTLDIFNTTEQTKFEKYINEFGVNFFGIHSAADTEKEGWPFYTQFIGGKFISHGPHGNASFKLINTEHEATSHYSSSFHTENGEWYTFDFHDSMKQYNILVDLVDRNERSEISQNRPIQYSEREDYVTPFVWSHEKYGPTENKCKFLYTGFGHFIDENILETDPDLAEHFKRGILWCLS